MLLIFVCLPDSRKLRSFMKLGAFKVSPSDLPGVHSCIKWEPVSSEGLGEREQTTYSAQAGGSENTAQRGPGSLASLPGPS